MKKFIVIELLAILFFTELVLAQQSYPEDEPIYNLPTGILYQKGPGNNNATDQWKYQYGTKLTINGSIWRNFEIMITRYPYGELILRLWDPNASVWTKWRRIITENKNGDVGIGTTNPTAKLAVNGDIKTKELIVTEQSSDWPDYVFERGYQMLNLKQLEEFIKANKHLPGIPTKNDIERKGQIIGAIQIKLLKKIEELVLYVISLKKENEEQAKQIESLKKELHTLSQN